MTIRLQVPMQIAGLNRPAVQNGLMTIKAPADIKIVLDLVIPVPK